MTEVIMYNSIDLAIILLEILAGMFVFAIVKGWYDNRRWEKHIYQIVEQYRSKYGINHDCEMLMYKELKKDDDDMVICQEELKE